MPGGHIDPGETLQQGVIREVLEETGIKVEHEEEASGIKPILMFESASGSNSGQ